MPNEIKHFDSFSGSKNILEYVNGMKSLLAKIDIESVISLRDALFKCWKSNKTVYLAGNGGSESNEELRQVMADMDEREEAEVDLSQRRIVRTPPRTTPTSAIQLNRTSNNNNHRAEGSTILERIISRNNIGSPAQISITRCPNRSTSPP